MKVLMITGDKKFTASERYRLQAAQVEKLEVVYWGRGALWPTLLQEKFDVVTAQDPFWRGLFAWWAAHKVGAKLNIQIHTDISVQSLFRHILARIVLRRASSIRVVSQKIKQQVESLGIRVPIHVLPIYIDISKFKNIVRQPHDRKMILWIGRLEEEKDPEEALRLFKAIRDEGINASLVILGVGGLEGKLKRIKSAYQLEYRDKIEFPGWRDPDSYLAMADVVVSTSHHESYGASIIEALAAGVPVVAPDVGIAKEAGAIVVPRQELAAKVSEVLGSNIVGKLQIDLPSEEEWAKQWIQTL
jgi:glycosyltransferase involved in cell wall biosynthesis